MPPIRKNHSNRDIDFAMDPGDLQPVTPYSADLKDEYQEAQHTLNELRQREEMIRRKAEQLEEISQKEEAFFEGRSELTTRLEEYLELLDREAANSRRVAQECATTHQRFHHHLNTILSLRPEAVDRRDLSMELDLALRHIEAAEADVSVAGPLIDQISNQHRGSTAPVRNREERVPAMEWDFFFWLKAGFAFCLPVMTLVIVLAMAIYLLR